MDPIPVKNQTASGVNYFFQGARLLWHPSLRAYILVPLLVNIILFVVLTGLLISYLGVFSGALAIEPPNWLAWAQPAITLLGRILGAVLIVIALLIYAYSFNIITNIIAAPFYGLLAEKTEELLTGVKPISEPLSAMIPRVLGRELTKLWYFITRGILVTLIMIFLGTLPIIQLLAPLVGLAWGAWCMTIQYADYPADNHKLSFVKLRSNIWQCKYSSTGFGAIVMGCSVIPIFNIFAMPAAVTGGTLFWLNELRDCDQV
ncbi:sulfate transporter CysZ [Teredinibacter waterburyi]|jgi:Uncharacterized protein involved in cysteine biosynthesis|uniref:sulfate transporter CysZ n=1 Tax=Teredinibacter waterburyi TaxID=1500538 RepID=UPI00165EE127|nr:sulfate transporter CysZ [Teredinibacter waterburyi]